MFRVPSSLVRPLPPLPDRFGVRGTQQLSRDLRTVLRDTFRGARFQVGPSSVGHLRPDLALPAYAGLAPADGMAPIMNLFDRSAGGQHYSQRVTKHAQRDFRGGRLSYDEHDGTDFVCPVGTPLVAAAPGTVVMIRDRWLRGGLTVAVDHGHGVVTQYTHCARADVQLGQTVRRGERVAVSGAAGIDLTTFFPWVPPHVHFMVWVDGIPVDPFLAEGEDDRAGAWTERNRAFPAAPRPEDRGTPELSPVDEDALRAVITACLDRDIQRELNEAMDEHPAYAAAIAEDALHHDEGAWLPPMRRHPVRPSSDEVAPVRVMMPLPATDYRGARFADGPGTAPPT